MRRADDWGDFARAAVLRRIAQCSYPLSPKLFAEYRARSRPVAASGRRAGTAIINDTGGGVPALLSGTGLRGRLLDRPQDQLEPEVPAGDCAERFEGVRPESVELRGRVEVGDCVLTVPHAPALVHRDVK